jgi:opacity protein-like surface antigen
MKNGIIAIVLSVLAAGAANAAEAFSIPVNSLSNVSVPAVRMSPVYSEGTLDKSLQSAVDNLKQDPANAGLVQDFVCLKVFGTYEQKYQFVYGQDKTFVMPERCQRLTAEIRMNNVSRNAITDAANSALKWVCRAYTHAVTYYQCDSNNENCDEKIKNVVEQSCDWE